MNLIADERQLQEWLAMAPDLEARTCPRRYSAPDGYWIPKQVALNPPRAKDLKEEVRLPQAA